MVDIVFDRAEEYFGKPRSVFLGHSRKRELVIIRQMIVAIMREKKYSWKKIGRLLNRNHSTIIHSLNMHKLDMETIEYAMTFDSFRECAIDTFGSLPRREAIEIMYKMEDAKTLNDRIVVLAKSLKNYKDGISTVV